MPARESVFDKKPEVKELKKESKKFLITWYDFLAVSLRSEIVKKPKEFFLIFIATLIGTILVVFIVLNLIFNRVSINISMPTFFLPNIPTIEVLGGSHNTLAFDPAELLGKISGNDNNYVLIDIRSKSEFNEGHIKTSINVPVYGTDLIDKNGKLNFGEIKKQINKFTKGKDLILIYGRTQFSTYPSLIAQKMDGNKVKPLAIGWNEWAHFGNLWIPEYQWNKINLQEFIQTRD